MIILYYLVSEDNLSYNDITYDYIKFNLTEPTESNPRSVDYINENDFAYLRNISFPFFGIEMVFVVTKADASSEHKQRSTIEKQQG